MPDPAKVLILTPMKSAARYLDRYFAALERLRYPAAALSLGILEGDSEDDTYTQLEQRLPDAGRGFARKSLFRKDFGLRMPPGVPRHVQPHCVTEPGGKTFDHNAWCDGGRKHMDDLRGQELVRLDSVGGTMLLVRADRHPRRPCVPPFFYGARSRWIREEHPLRGIAGAEIETEGLGIMAKDMGIECWGLPDLEIRHAKN